jgi:glycerol-1-phosphate dehydrogenase [NAD(P)+]
MRLVQIPTYLRMHWDDEGVFTSLYETIEVHSWARVLIISGTGFTSSVAERLASAVGAQCITVESPTFEEVLRAERCCFDLTPDVVIGVGGGSPVDVAKYAAHRARIPFLCVPTQASNDGISSPIAVISGSDGRRHSLGATVPVGVVAPLHVIAAANPDTARAGVGDLLANLSAIEDWRLAHDAGADKYDDFAALMSRHGAELVVALLERHRSLVEKEAVEALVEGLVLSGIAMSLAGSSRPCSGAEHLVSHAIDELFGGVSLHGLQVGAATPLILELQGNFELATRVRGALRMAGAPCSLESLGLSTSQIDAALARAPFTRTGRYTVLSHVSKEQTRLSVAPVGAA